VGAGTLLSGQAPLPAAEGRAAVMAAELAERLREMCALMLAEGAPGPEMAAWCRRMLADPGAAERAVRAAQEVTTGSKC
jgi:hypothetical protein